MKSSTGKLVVAIVLLVVAGVIFVRYGIGGSEKPALAEDAQAINFVCTSCGEHSALTYDEMQKATAEAGTEASGEEEPQQMVRGGRGAARRPVAILCPKCGEKAALRAAHCQQHDTYYPVEDLDGNKGACPKCP